MAETRCIKCDEEGWAWPIFATSFLRRNAHATEANLIGIATCERHSHSWPITIRHNTIVSISESLDPIGTDGLNILIGEGLRQDLFEAARCYQFGLNKGAAVLARRVAQLAFEDKIPNLNKDKQWTLGQLIPEARKVTPPLLTAPQFAHADVVHATGDAGAHHAVDIPQEAARAAVWGAVQVVNGLYGVDDD